MKKITVVLVGNSDDGYETVSSSRQYPKWEFKSSPILECVLMERKSLPNTNGQGTYDIYTVMEKNSRKPYAFFCGKVLEDKLKAIPLYSLVKIAFEGVHPQKRYHQFTVQINKNFRYDPNIYNLDTYEDVDNGPAFQTIQQQQSTAKTVNQPTNGAPVTAPSVQQRNTGFATPPIDEDLPF